MRTELELILENYSQARAESFASHPTAQFIRNDVREGFSRTVETLAPDFHVETSAGKGGWTDTPWIAILDPLVTETPQEGIYIAYLFSASMDRLYLSLNQGIPRFREQYGVTIGRSELRRRAALMRATYPEYSLFFDANPIDLAATGQSTRGAFYEVGHAFGKSYGSNLPEEDSLVVDLREMIHAYRQITFSSVLSDPDQTDAMSPSDTPAFVEYNNRLRLHWRIERNRRLIQKVKELQGNVCRACGFDYEIVYGEIGRGFIEAHHNVPVADLPPDRAVPLDPMKDFTVLCASCHRMVHQKQPPLTITELKTAIREAAH